MQDVVSEMAPSTVHLELTVREPEVVAELCKYQEEQERDEYALLNPGVMHTVATGSGGHLGLYRLMCVRKVDTAAMQVTIR